jgi:TonB family protein
LDGKPVPILVYVRVPFLRISPPIPVILPRYPQAGVLSPISGTRGWSTGTGLRQSPPFDKPPVVLYAPPAEFSDQARAAKYNAIVLVSVLVTEEGLTADAKVERAAGMGLDEKAIKAISQYRFMPATKDGVPLAVRITVEINFSLGRTPR